MAKRAPKNAPPVSEPSAPIGRPNLVRLYAGMVATLENLGEGAALGDLFAQVRASGESRSLPIETDDEILRMLSRIGLVPPGVTPEVAAKHAETVVREMAESVSRTPAQISLIFRLYAAGLYGVLPQPLCGVAPRCRECGITKDCDYFNQPPKIAVDERIPPAKRLLRDGPSALTDEEVVALILGGGRTGEEHEVAAKTLLRRYGTLRALAGAPHGEIAALRDVTDGMALRLSAAAAYQFRIAQERRHLGPSVRSGKDFYDIYAPALRDLKKEVFLVVLLDQKNRILRDERVSEGTLTASIVHPREVFALAVRESAAAIAFVHNHPSGDSTPSPEDKALTKRLRDSADLFGIRVLDHVIIGEGSYTSFLDEGLL